MRFNRRSFFLWDRILAHVRAHLSRQVRTRGRGCLVFDWRHEHRLVQRNRAYFVQFVGRNRLDGQLDSRLTRRLDGRIREIIRQWDRDRRGLRNEILIGRWLGIAVTGVALARQRAGGRPVTPPLLDGSLAP
jgi:hypothetical protein